MTTYRFLLEIKAIILENVFAVRLILTFDLLIEFLL